MKSRIIFLLAVALALSASLAAAEKTGHRTIIVKDGKVIEDGRVFDLDGELFGFSRAYLGVSLIDPSEDLRSYFGAPRDQGVLVSDVAEDSPAARAGVRAGDVILSVEGKDVQSSWDVRRGLREKKSGDTARVEILRDKSRQTLVLTVAERNLSERMIGPLHLEELGRNIGETFNSPEWKARVQKLGDCEGLQTRIKDLETRLKELEKKLQK